MDQFKFELCTVLKDVVTGYEGIAMGRTQYVTGCNHYGLLSRKLTQDGKPYEWVWFDETRLVRVGTEIIKFGVEQPAGGPCSDPPEM